MANTTSMTDVFSNMISYPISISLQFQDIIRDSLSRHGNKTDSRHPGVWIDFADDLFGRLMEFGTREITRPSAYSSIAYRKIPEAQWWGNHEVMDIPGLEGLVVRHYKKEKDKLGNPLCIGAPMAGHTSHIIHHKKGQSMIETAHQAGINDVFAFEYTTAPLSRKDEDIGSYLEKNKIAVEAIRDRVYSGKSVRMDLVGCCQNGWQLALYTSFWPEDVRWLVASGAPIDTQAGDSDIKKIVNSVPYSFFEGLVNSGGGIIDGKQIVAGFWTLDSLGRLNDAVSLFNNVHDSSFTDRHVDFYNWYRGHTIKMPGRFYLQTVKEHFMENRIVKGEFVTKVFGKERKADLGLIGKRYGHKIMTIGGTKDNITDPVDCHNLCIYADVDGGTGYCKTKTPPEDMERLLSYAGKKAVQVNAEAGHLGLFISKRVLNDYYRPAFGNMVLD